MRSFCSLTLGIIIHLSLSKCATSSVLDLEDSSGIIALLSLDGLLLSSELKKALVFFFLFVFFFNLNKHTI